MRFIVCPDSFKGSLSASEVASTMANAIKRSFPEDEVITLPLADGGEGSLDILSRTQKFTRKNLSTLTPHYNEIKTYCFVNDESKTAYIESASIIGLHLVPESLRNPCRLSSFGLGVAIEQARKEGYKEIYVFLGGSATCDGGMGMLHAMGVRFFDRNHKLLSPSGLNLKNISHIEADETISKYQDTRFYVVVDVQNPLIGANGAAPVFAPQKGANQDDVSSLDLGLANLSGIMVNQGYDLHNNAHYPGAGAAGGIAYSLLTLFKSTMLNGIDYMLECVGIDRYLNSSCVIFTGEGSVDRQSMMGKVLSGILRKAEKYGCGVVAVGGKIEDYKTLTHPNLIDVVAISSSELSLKENMEHDIAVKNLQRTMETIMANKKFINFGNNND